MNILAETAPVNQGASVETRSEFRQWLLNKTAEISGVLPGAQRAADELAVRYAREKSDVLCAEYRAAHGTASHFLHLMELIWCVLHQIESGSQPWESDYRTEGLWAWFVDETQNKGAC